MSDPIPPLTLSTVVGFWTWDTGSAVLIVLLSVVYGWAYRRSRLGAVAIQAWRPLCFGVGVGLWIVATMSMVGVYAYALFWVRALQVLLLLFVIPFFLAMGQPVTVLRGGLDPACRDRVDRLLRSGLLLVLAHPFTTSVAMLATPWLLYLTPWYVAALEHQAVGALTRALLLLVGFGYFYAPACKQIPCRASTRSSFQ